jgi:uncharacterized membrane protein
MAKLIVTYLIALVSFLVIDMLWLGVIARNFYKEKLGFILSPDVKWSAAIVFYLIYIFGILFFAVNPALKEMSWKIALVNAAILGAMCYATYDLTNMATIAKWPLVIVVIDIVWGMVLSASVSLITYGLVTRIY